MCKTLEWAKDLVHIYINNKLLWKQLSVNPTTWFDDYMLFEKSMLMLMEVQMKDT